LPVLEPLAQSIAAGPTGDMCFIAGERGGTLTPESFTNWFRDACREAGVPGSPHGLRKAAATRAANNGATAAQLEAMFGWRGGGMAALYTRKADRAKLARDAAGKLLQNKDEIPIPAHSTKRGKDA
jgi:integrase